MKKVLTYDEIVRLEPRIKDAEALAVQHAGKDSDHCWYHTIKPAFKALVGLMSTSPHTELHSSAAYDTVYRRLHGLYEGRTQVVSAVNMVLACGHGEPESKPTGGEMLLVDGMVLERIRFGQELSGWGDEFDNCPDCGVAHGGLHQPGCDIEECPKCGGQIIACECRGTAQVVDAKQVEAQAIRWLDDIGAKPFREVRGGQPGV